MSQEVFSIRSHNPDVLTCIANLSNDEVITPPDFANQMLDTLEKAWAKSNSGEDLWSNKEVTFLDPATKSGVFLREIVKRLNAGLAKQIPDLTERINHILTKQVFGIGITELTSLLARRSVYCSKNANGIHSIARTFSNESGNIWFERTEHIWLGNKCKFCSANKSEYERNKDLESHAYAFIHTNDINTLLEELFGEKMRFDVIIGNPPYQLSDGGGEGSSAMPLYHRFVSQAKKLESKYLVMVIPARWYSGGKGLDDFRSEMLNDTHLAEIHDFPETEMVFPGLSIRGGICYFLIDTGHKGESKIFNYKKNRDPQIAMRPLLEPGLDSFVRYNEAISILKKVSQKKEPTFDTRVQSRNPFGIPSDFSKFSITKSSTANIHLFRSRRGSSTEKNVFISEKFVQNNLALKDKIKVLVSKASPGGDEYPHSVIGKPFVAPKNSVSTETYLIIDFPSTIEEGNNLISYMETRFFRFLVSLIKNTQNISKGSFAFVPIQDFSKPWSDVILYKKYGITKEEIIFIESMVRPVGSDSE